MMNWRLQIIEEASNRLNADRYCMWLSTVYHSLLSCLAYSGPRKISATCSMSEMTVLVSSYWFFVLTELCELKKTHTHTYTMGKGDEGLSRLLHMPKFRLKTKDTAQNNNVKSKSFQNSRNLSTYSIIPLSEVTQGAVEVWATLPDEIRQDPSLASFRQEHERLHGKWIFISSFCFVCILRAFHRCGCPHQLLCIFTQRLGILTAPWATIKLY